MQIEVLDGDETPLLLAIEKRLVELGVGYGSSYAEDLEIAALQRTANQFGVAFQLDGGNTGFKVKRTKA